MARRFSGFRGSLTALGLLFALWIAGNLLSPDGWELVPRQLLLSENQFVGRGSHAEQVCRRIPLIHEFLWPDPG